jgi:hypothetical protein
MKFRYLVNRKRSAFSRKNFHSKTPPTFKPAPYHRSARPQLAIYPHFSSEIPLCDFIICVPAPSLNLRHLILTCRILCRIQSSIRNSKSKRVFSDRLARCCPKDSSQRYELSQSLRTRQSQKMLASISTSCNLHHQSKHPLRKAPLR